MFCRPWFPAKWNETLLIWLWWFSTCWRRWTNRTNRSDCFGSAHVGIVGNKRADQAAKEAVGTRRAAKFWLPPSDLNVVWKEKMFLDIFTWAKNRGLSKGSYYFEWFARRKRKPWFHGFEVIIRKAMVSMNRLRSGHTSLAESLFKRLFKISRYQWIPAMRRDALRRDGSVLESFFGNVHYRKWRGWRVRSLHPVGPVSNIFYTPLNQRWCMPLPDLLMPSRSRLTGRASHVSSRCGISFPL